MSIYTLPTILVYVFAVGGVALILILLWTAQRRMTPSNQRPKYRSKKIVDDYYDKTEKTQGKVNHSAISGHLMKHWREGLQDPEDF
ncbi:MAG: hypothetical protein P9M07_01535 [Candidatus Aceula meridiana]|nr:hypothetical protein [Candidatus Aceula meridiana]